MIHVPPAQAKCRSATARDAVHLGAHQARSGAADEALQKAVERRALGRVEVTDRKPARVGTEVRERPAVDVGDHRVAAADAVLRGSSTSPTCSTVRVTQSAGGRSWITARCRRSASSPCSSAKPASSSSPRMRNGPNRPGSAPSRNGVEDNQLAVTTVTFRDRRCPTNRQRHVVSGCGWPKTTRKQPRASRNVAATCPRTGRSHAARARWPSPAPRGRRRAPTSTPPSAGAPAPSGRALAQRDLVVRSRSGDAVTPRRGQEVPVRAGGWSYGRRTLARWASSSASNTAMAAKVRTVAVEHPARLRPVRGRQVVTARVCGRLLVTAGCAVSCSWGSRG